jgi:hypothetical protein
MEIGNFLWCLRMWYALSFFESVPMEGKKQNGPRLDKEEYQRYELHKLMQDLLQI